MVRVMNNAYKQYCKSRPAPSSESLKRSKSFSSVRIGFHPIFSMFRFISFISAEYLRQHAIDLRCYLSSSAVN